jgi:hypothetical protein
MKTGKDHREILRAVRRVRRRWRLRIALRGLALAAAVSLGVLFLSALALERLRFVPDAVLWLRVATWGILGVSLLVFLVRPLLRRVDERRVALYLEEHEPSLDHAVVSALEAPRSPSASPALSGRLLSTAMGQVRAVDYGRRVDQRGLYRFGGVLTALTVAAVTLVLMGPAHLRIGLTALLLPTRDAASVNPYSVSVAPGDVTIARGSDQMVTADLRGFDAGEASVFTRTGPDASFQRLSMLPADQGGFEVLLLGIADRTEYFVESSGVRSPTYAIDVADLPYVDRLDLTYHFPAYTGLPPRVVEDGGDVVALPGTEVEVRVTPTIPAPGGRLIVDSTSAAELQVAADGSLVGRFTVRQDGFYSVELGRDSGELVAASPEYAIDVLADGAPTVRFTEPGRDTPASPIEEVYLEVRADDDYGVGDVRLVYSVNGAPEDTVSIFRAGGSPLPQVSAGHTLFLEEWSLEPGDLVSYYALARDNRPGSADDPVTSDIYFLKVRPFERTYRQGESQPQGGQAGQNAGTETALSELQRQIIAATFNLIRQKDSYASDEFSENVVSVALAQERLKEQVATLLQRMQSRGLVDTEAGIRSVSEVLPKAAEAMDSAKSRLDGEALQEAMPHEQSALRYLQQAEETYERQVVQQQGGQGGGEGGQSAAADDLADLFELELDKLKNQYETVERGQQQSADDQVDETLEKLEELARRQQQEAERQRRRAQAGQGASQGGSQSQRDLADETEEAARQLQRLARQNNDAALEETARRLEEAANAMRRSATNAGSASADAATARERLEEARRRLQDVQEDRARRDADQAMQRVEDLQRQQRDVQRQVRELPDDPGERRGQVDRLQERKDQMTDAVADLERQLDRAAQVAQEGQPDAARKLKDAADQIRESKLKEKLQYSKGTIEQWDPATATTLEMTIESDLQDLHDRLGDARTAAGDRQADPLEEALEQTRDLVRAMESMDRRLRDATEEPQDQQGGDPSSDDPSGRSPQGRGGAGQPGQPGSQPPGQPGGGGRPPTDVGPDTPPGAGGGARGNPRPLSDEEVRQLRREFSQRADQVGELRERLSDAGQDAADLTAVLEAMRRLEAQSVYENPEQVAALQDEVLESLKRLEFGLRRQVEGTGERRAALGTSDEVPDAYRKLVEEYYRKLAASRRGGGGS